MDFLKNPFILLTNPFVFPFLIFLLLVLAINLPFIIFFYAHGFFSLFNPYIKQSDKIDSDKFNLQYLGFLFLPTRIAVKSIEVMQDNFRFQHTLFIVIFGLFVIWQILKNGYLLFNIFGWNWLSWIGFVVALVVLIFVIMVGIASFKQGVEKRWEWEERVEEIIKQRENKE